MEPEQPCGKLPSEDHLTEPVMNHKEPANEPGWKPVHIVHPLRGLKVLLESFSNGPAVPKKLLFSGAESLTGILS